MLTKPGDLVVQMNGNEYPSVLRPDEDHYLFLGNCYIDGAMFWQEEYVKLEEELRQKPKQIFDLH